MELIDGNRIAGEVLGDLKQRIQKLTGPPPKVAFIRVGEDPASVSYVSKKQRTAAELGIESELNVLSEDIDEATLHAIIDRLNADEKVHGILIQSPLPSHLDERGAFDRVHPDKDVDGFHRINLGRLCQDDSDGFVACTPAGIVELLRRSGVETRGRHVVVLGRSLIVGKPVALLLMRKGAGGDATVTVCHSRTENLPAVTASADILIAAIGRPRFVTAEMVKPGAVVIDVGINRIPDATRKSAYRLVGDVDFDAVKDRVSMITPVPGGVGPMTVAMLMSNTLKACEKRHQETTADPA